MTLSVNVSKRSFVDSTLGQVPSFYGSADTGFHIFAVRLG